MSKLFLLLLSGLVATITLSGCTGEAKDTHPEQLVTKRRAVFKQFTRTLEPIGLVARGRKDYNPREVNASALELQKLAQQPWALFSADSNYPPTHAKPEVWQKAAEFKQAQEQYLATVSQLVKAAEAGDLEHIKPAVSAVEKSCKSCHDQFRNEAAS